MSKKLGKILTTLDLDKLPARVFYHGLKGDYYPQSDGSIVWVSSSGEPRPFCVGDFKRNDWEIVYR